MAILTLIPVRMGSTRFPGKPLKKIAGREMLLRVHDACKTSKHTDELYVATCDDEIVDFCIANDIQYVRTKASHERASDRCAEALEKIESTLNKKFDYCVMVQGDEPMVTGDMIDMAVDALIRNKEFGVVNLTGPINSDGAFQDKNTIKCVSKSDNEIMYLSRMPIPTNGQKNARKQVCVIPFRSATLRKFSMLNQTATEFAESIDMLRLIENGIKVLGVPIDVETFPVDTEADLLHVESILNN